MAALGFIFCFLILVWFTWWIVFDFYGKVIGKLSTGEAVVCLVLLLSVLDIYLWVCLFDNSPFVLVAR